jgi:acyl-CoA thioester hydrolase
MNQIRARRVPALEDFPYRQDITVRVSDLDGYGHINAIRTGHFYEDARAAFYKPLYGGVPPIRALVAQLNINYIKEGFWPGAVAVGTGIARLGTASFEMAQALFQNGVCLGTCATVLVNTSKGASAPLPQSVRDRLTLFMVQGETRPD